MVKGITIVGVGALGSHVAQFLRSEKLPLTVIDMDRVEQKNLLSQFHGKPNLGKNKAVSLSSTATFMWGVKWMVCAHELTKSNASVLLHPDALVIDCLDNIKTRNLVQEEVRKNNLPCLHGALAPDGVYGRVICRRPDDPAAWPIPARCTIRTVRFQIASHPDCRLMVTKKQTLPDRPGTGKASPDRVNDDRPLANNHTQCPLFVCLTHRKSVSTIAPDSINSTRLILEDLAP